MLTSVSRLWWGLVRFGFRLLYHEMAWTYDLVSKAVSLNKWRDWQQQTIQFLPNPETAQILELAHGTGDLQLDLKDAGYSTVGFDLSPQMGRITRRKLQKHKKQAHLVRGSALQLPFRGAAIEAVVSTFPTEFIVHEATLREVFRVLSPGGRFIVVPNGMLTLTGPVTQFLEWLYQITGQRAPYPDDPVKEFTDAGFTADVREIELVSSKVWIVVADKPEKE